MKRVDQPACVGAEETYWPPPSAVITSFRRTNLASAMGQRPAERPAAQGAEDCPRRPQCRDCSRAFAFSARRRLSPIVGQLQARSRGELTRACVAPCPGVARCVMYTEITARIAVRPAAIANARVRRCCSAASRSASRRRSASGRVRHASTASASTSWKISYWGRRLRRHRRHGRSAGRRGAGAPVLLRPRRRPRSRRDPRRHARSSSRTE